MRRNPGFSALFFCPVFLDGKTGILSVIETESKGAEKHV
ncbi:hypothetical protein B4144_0277 [Bacillus atrophaeus]|nr:hypothetical protein B4144_0277 [Bacillus atrophaeus]